MSEDVHHGRAPVGEKQSQSWIQTFTGLAFDPLNPDPKAMCLEDIAHHLSMLCRYTGAVRCFYSVAEHCCRVSDFMGTPEFLTQALSVPLYPEQWRIEGLLHDGFEAYLTDLANPVKMTPELEGYRKLEKAGDQALAIRFGLLGPIDDRVKALVRYADLVLLNHERGHLLGREPESWGNLPAVPPGLASTAWNFGWAPDYAEKAFLNRARGLGIK